MNGYKECVIELMRHGEPEGGRMFRGSMDDPLSETGWQQMRDAWARLNPTESATMSRGKESALSWKKIVSSPLIRCSAFAEEAARVSGLPLEIEPAFSEMSFGEWEGMAPDDVVREFPGKLEAFWRDSVTHGAPGGESMMHFQKRIVAAWRLLKSKNLDDSLLLVCHGGTIRMILAHVLDMPLTSLWRIAVPFANLSRIKIVRYADGSETQMLVSHQQMSY